MKKKLLLYLAITSYLSYGQDNEIGRFSEILRESNQTNLKQNSSIPGFIEFSTGNEPALNEITSILNTFSKKEFTLNEVKREKDQLGYTHIKYQQAFNGIPVELSFITVHIKKGIILSLSNNLTSLEPNSNSASLSEKSALDKTLSRINAAKYKWEIPGEEMFIKEDQC